jgi:PhnB protein
MTRPCAATRAGHCNSEDTAMPIQPYLFFNGRCEEAIGFYQRALGAQVEMLMRFKDSPDPPPPGAVPPGHEDKVMHASLRIGDSVLMASDGCAEEAARFDGFALSLTPADAAQARGLFDALADGGEVRMALAPTFWSPCFGMLVDRFGVSWMVNVIADGEAPASGSTAP